MKLVSIKICCLLLGLVISGKSANGAESATRIAHSTDDAEEAGDGEVFLDSSDLELIEDEYEGPQLVGLRFQNVFVPQGATISSACIEFTVDETTSIPTSLTLYGQAFNDAPTFTSTYHDISSRPLTGATVLWNNVPAWTEQDDTHQSPDLATLVQEIVNRSGWASGNAIAFVIDGTGQRIAHSYDAGTSSSTSPLLKIVYDPPPTPPPTSTPSLLEIRVSRSSDDAEEAGDGEVFLDSSDLELVEDEYEGLQVVGIRFWGVPIPQGAVVVSAHVEFTVDEASSIGTSLMIHGQASDDASSFTTASHDISSRPKTSSSVLWNNIPAWNILGDQHQSPDLSAVVQDIVDSPGWSAGNSVAFIISGTGQRIADSFDGGGGGSTSTAPLLRIEYATTGRDNPTSSPPTQKPTREPTPPPTELLTKSPTSLPTQTPTPLPTRSPTSLPTQTPTPLPTRSPTSLPTQTPTPLPTRSPTSLPTQTPTREPTPPPTELPTQNPTPKPTLAQFVSLPPTETVARIKQSTDDAEEKLIDGEIFTDSSDLELIEDEYEGEQAVGLRFGTVWVPQGAVVSSARVEFTVDEPTSISTSLWFHVEASDKAPTFTSSFYDITSRSLVAPVVGWFNVPPWSTEGYMQQGPDVKSLVQEIVDRPGWSPGNAIVFVIYGIGQRIANSYDGGGSNLAPTLRIEYEPSCTDGLFNGDEVAVDCGGSCSACGGGSGDPVPVGQSGTWNLVFSDEFDGSSVDQGKWERGWFSNSGYSQPVNDLEDGCYHPSQLSVSGGNLHLKAEAHSHPNCRKKGGSQASYVSGLVNSRLSFTFSYGYTEARVWLPSDSGGIQNWPAVWTTGFNHPTTGEIDIMEGLSSRQPCSSYHWGSDTNYESITECASMTNPGGWHIFAAKWEPGKITYFYDGMDCFVHTEGVVGSPHYIILNQGVNSNYGIDVPATMLVDYIRVWSLP